MFRESITTPSPRDFGEPGDLRRFDGSTVHFGATRFSGAPSWANADFRAGSISFANAEFTGPANLDGAAFTGARTRPGTRRPR